MLTLTSKLDARASAAENPILNPVLLPFGGAEGVLPA
jgi:hypothetical protein